MSFFLGSEQGRYAFLYAVKCNIIIYKIGSERQVMANNYKVIDENNWKRALHCQIFRNSVEPSYCIKTLKFGHFSGLLRARKQSAIVKY